MPDVHRAGGHIERGDGKGWVVDDTPTPLPEPVPHAPPTYGPTEVGGHRLTPEGWVLVDPGKPYEARRKDPVASAEHPAPRKRAAKRPAKTPAKTQAAKRSTRKEK